MSRRAQENLIALFVLGVFIAAIFASTGYGPRARLVPIPIAVLGSMLILAQLILQNFHSEKDLEIDLLDFISRKATGDHDDGGASSRGETAPDADQGGAEPQNPGLTWKKEIAAAGLVVLLVAMFLMIGPLPAMLVFTAGYFILSRHYTPGRGLLYAFGCTAAVYALFYLWLGVDMRLGVIDLGFGILW